MDVTHTKNEEEREIRAPQKKRAENGGAEKQIQHELQSNNNGFRHSHFAAIFPFDLFLSLLRTNILYIQCPPPCRKTFVREKFCKQQM